MKCMDAGADTGALDTLIAHAEASNKERAQVANGSTPSYSLFHDAALQLAQCLDTDGDVPLTTVSKCVYMLLLTAVCPGRERMLLYVRATDSDLFKANEDHTRDVLEALCAEHPKHADSMTLATVLFTAGEPTTLVVGVHGCSDPRKNEFYHEVDLTSPILPAAQDLLPLLHDSLKLLYRDYEAESFMLRAKPDGAAHDSGIGLACTSTLDRVPATRDYFSTVSRPGSTRSSATSSSSTFFNPSLRNLGVSF